MLHVLAELCLAPCPFEYDLQLRVSDVKCRGALFQA
jgi:hypothetical protein